MATKSRTSKKTSNDKQKKLLALVLIILFIGLGVFLVVSSFAAKGGKNSGSGNSALVDSNYSIKAQQSVVKYPNSVALTAIYKNGTALPLPLPEEMAIVGSCNYNGTNVGWFGSQLSPDNPNFVAGLTNPSLANGATCTAYLQVRRNFAWANTAVTTFTITP